MDNQKLVRGLIAGVGAILAMFLADWILGGGVLSSMTDLNMQKIRGIGIGLALLIVVLIGLAVYGVSKSQDKWEFNRLYNTYKNRIRNLFWDKIDDVSTQMGIKGIWHKRRILPDKFPEIMRENIVYLFSLNNYLKRYYIAWAKYGQVTDANKICVMAEGWSRDYLNYFEDEERLFKDCHSCRTEGVIHQKATGADIPVGINKAMVAYCNEMNRFSRLIGDLRAWYAQVVGGTNTMTTEQRREYATKVQGNLSNLSTSITDNILTPLKNSTKYYEDRVKAYGDLQLIKSQIYLILDQDNPYGEQEHQYRFVPPGTKLIYLDGYDAGVAEDEDFSSSTVRGPWQF